MVLAAAVIPVALFASAAVVSAVCAVARLVPMVVVAVSYVVKIEVAEAAWAVVSDSSLVRRATSAVT